MIHCIYAEGYFPMHLEVHTVKLVMFACSKYCVFFIFSFMRVLINANQTRCQISETEGTDLCVF